MKMMKICVIGVVLFVLLLALTPMTYAKISSVSNKITDKKSPTGFLNKLKNLISYVIRQFFPDKEANDPDTGTNDDPKQDENETEDEGPQASEDEEEDIRDLCDINGDGTVTSKDIALLEAFYGKKEPYLTVVSNPDLDESGLVDIADLAEVLGCCGPCDAGTPEDFNGDQVINECDVNILKAFYGQSCDLKTVKNPDLDHDGDVDLADLSLLIANID